MRQPTKFARLLLKTTSCRQWVHVKRSQNLELSTSPRLHQSHPLTVIWPWKRSVSRCVPSLYATWALTCSPPSSRRTRPRRPILPVCPLATHHLNAAGINHQPPRMPPTQCSAILQLVSIQLDIVCFNAFSVRVCLSLIVWSLLRTQYFGF